MARNLDIGQALRYPFQNDNWRGTLLWPGLVFLVLLLVSVVLGMTVGGIFAALEGPGAASRMASAANAVVTWVVVLVLYPWLWGYFQELAARFRQGSYDAPAPDWTDRLASLWVDGFKVQVFVMLVTLPYFVLPTLLMALGQDLLYWAVSGLLVLIYIPLAPFIMAVPVQSLHERSWKRVFDVGRTWEAGKAVYGKAMLALLISFAFSLLGIPLMILLCCTCVGYLAVAAYLYIVSTHLFIQAFDGYRPAEHGVPGPMDQLEL